jgi:hypothetical protein
MVPVQLREHPGVAPVLGAIVADAGAGASG